MVIGVVAVILVAAVVTVNLTEGSGYGDDQYLTENTPSAPVYNAFVAFQQGDVQTARQQYSARVLEELDAERGYNPFADRFAQRTARRMRIVEVTEDVADSNRAYVSVVIDTYSGGGLFGTGSSWSRRLVVNVVRETETGTAAQDGIWKLDTQEYFY